MEKCIAGAKHLIEKQVRSNHVYFFGEAFSEYQKVYFWTNEIIKGYIDKVDFEGKKSALSVTSSGDHAFNLITNGILEVDTFDTNRLTEYFAFGLKRAMILKYSYYEFNDISKYITSEFISLDSVTEVIKGLLPYMEAKHKKFWDEISDYNHKIQKENNNHLNLFSLITMGWSHTLSNNNNYLVDKGRYNNLRNNLGKANISFTKANALNLDETFNKKYDFLLLSNILNYFYKIWGYGFDYSVFYNYEKQLEKLMNSDGVIFLNYLYDYYNSVYTREMDLFQRSKAFVDALIGEDVLEIEVPGMTKMFSEGVLLKRVKK